MKKIIGLLAVFLIASQVSAATLMGGSAGGGGGGSGVTAGYTSVSFSATPAFSCTHTGIDNFLITLTGNVTSSTLSGCTTGEIITFQITQDATGGRSFVPPTNVNGMPTISSAVNSTASTSLTVTGVYDGTNFNATSASLCTGATCPPLALPGSTSGQTVLKASAIANGTLTLPAVTDVITHGNRSIGITIDGGGSAITTGFKGNWTTPFACNIISSTLTSDIAGSIVIDVWKNAAAIPTVANTITASALPTLSSGTYVQDTTLTGWTKSVAVNDVIGYNVNSASTLTHATLVLGCQ